MHRSRVVHTEDQDLAILNAKADALILDEEAWEDAIDDSGVDCDILCHSQWRSSTDLSGDLSGE